MSGIVIGSISLERTQASGNMTVRSDAAGLAAGNQPFAVDAVRRRRGDSRWASYTDGDRFITIENPAPRQPLELSVRVYARLESTVNTRFGATLRILRNGTPVTHQGQEVNVGDVYIRDASGDEEDQLIAEYELPFDVNDGETYELEFSQTSGSVLAGDGVDALPGAYVRWTAEVPNQN